MNKIAILRIKVLKMKFPWIRRNFSAVAHWLQSEGSESRERIISLVRDCLSGSWYTADSSNLLIKRIRGGLSNSVFQVTLPKIDEKYLKNEPNTVIIRFHQPLNLDSVFQHVSESLAFMFLSEKKFGPKLHAIFPGGRIEEYINARPLTTKELIDGKYSSAIAEKLAIFHSMSPPLSRKRGIIFDIMENWLKQTKMENFNWKVNNSDTQKCVDFFKHLDLTKEISWLWNFVEKMDSPIMFCHNDVQEGNILVTSESDGSKNPNITLIDYEYCFYNYQAFDFANHFLEYTMCYEPKDYPNFIINEENYPSQEHQLTFIRRYLAVRDHLQRTDGQNCEIPQRFSLGSAPDDAGGGREDITEREIRLLDEISKFQMASHLFWGIWAALRSQSHITFGYWEYCNSRLKAYYKLKEEMKD